MLIHKLNVRGSYWASEVTFDYGTNKTTRVDFMKFEPANNTTSGLEKGIFICYEIKSSLEDYRSHSGHNFFGEKNYYVMPMGVWNKLKGKYSVPHNIGCYVPVPKNRDTHDEYINPTSLEKATIKSWELRCVSRSNQINREYSNLVCLFNMFRSGR